MQSSLWTAIASALQDAEITTDTYLANWIFWVFGGGVAALLLGATGGGLRIWKVALPRMTAISRVLLLAIGVSLTTSGMVAGPMADVDEDEPTAEVVENGGKTELRPTNQETFDGKTVKVNGKPLQLPPGTRRLPIQRGDVVEVIDPAAAGRVKRTRVGLARR